ncbi:hypothetical protein F9B71_05510 [Staphylococcus epidermidis]|nr:hypothetical protein F9B71_05510 [Staphylococcus epidermidis]
MANPITYDLSSKDVCLQIKKRLGQKGPMLE